VVALAMQLIPPWWIWYYWICPVSWIINGLVNSQMGDVTTPLTVLGSEAKTKPNVAQYIKDTFGFERSFLKWAAVGAAGWALFFAFIFILAIKFLNFQRR
jgi:hypothetical protein